jgi:cyclase
LLKTRVIPVVLLRNGVVVQSKGFRRYQCLGNPTTVVQRLSDWASDELIYLDITHDAGYDLGRDDLNHPNRHEILDIVSDVARRCFMPLTFGGRIRTVEDAATRLRRGADKIAINTRAVEDPTFIAACARAFGSQCVVVSIDVHGSSAGTWQVYIGGGRTRTGLDAVTWAREAERRGAGEILINSIDRDGGAGGYDLRLVSAVVEAVSVPVIALGGAGDWGHLADVIHHTHVSAVAAANIFHYTEHSVYKAKAYLFDRGFNVRRPQMFDARHEERSEPCVTASVVSTPR